MVGKAKAGESTENAYDNLVAELAQRDVTAEQQAKANKLLEAEQAQPELVTALVGELREAALMKTVDGHKYPAKAFAYAPDPQKPSTWKLLLWQAEEGMTRAQVGRAAAALSPGGFRGQRVQIPSGDLATVKAKLRAAYSKLGVKLEDMSRWVKESEAVRRYACGNEVELGEGFQYDPAKGEGILQVIQAGFNRSKSRFYPAEVLERDGPATFSDVPLGVDHPTAKDQKERPEGSILHQVGRTREAYWDADTKTLRAPFVIVDEGFK